MIRARRLTMLLALAALAAAAVAATPAQAAKRKVPFGFFGTVVPPQLAYAGRTTDSQLDGQFALMARSGVESVRLALDWGDLEPAQGTYDFSNVDRLIRAASNHRLHVLINVTSTPRWASTHPDSPEYLRYPPRDLNAMGTLWGQLAARYGPKGTFWAQNPSVPKTPIRDWQVWNEESAPWHWQTRPWAPGYTNLLKSSYQAIKAVDRRATVIAGSVVASPGYSQWGAVRDLYRAGAKRWFDQLAVHPFTNNEKSVEGTIDQVIQIVELVRKQTRKAHDGRVPISLTELTWPASVGKIPRGGLLGLETNRKGQVKRMKAAYKRLAQQRRKLRITGAYWYTWASDYNRKGALSVVTFNYAGLTRIRGGGVFSPMPILRTYTSIARKYEGCRKSANARRCR
jgi:polysaccharide biosynthesis protein PslG